MNTRSGAPSRTTRVIGGASVGYLSQALVTIVGLWLTPFLLGRLGQEQYGLWLVLLQLVTYLGVLDLGVVALLPRQIAWTTGQGAHMTGVDLSDVVGTTLSVVFRQVPFVLVTGAVIWWFIPADWRAMRGPGAAILLVYVLAFPLRVGQATLQGLQDLTFAGWAIASGWAAGTCVTVILIVTTELGLFALAAGWAVTQLLTALLCWTRLALTHPAILPRRLPRLDGRAFRTRLTAGSWVSVSQVAQLLLQATDVFVIAAVLGPTVVVPYVVTRKLLDVLANQPQMIMQSALPALSEVRAAGDRDRLRQVTRALTQTMLLGTGAVCVVVLVANAGFVAWWIGPSAYAGHVLTTALIVMTVVRQWNTTTVYAMFCFGHERRIALTRLADGAVTVASALVLTMAFGPVGVVLGSLTGALAVSLPANLSVLRRETGEPVSESLAVLVPWFWRCATVMAAAFALELGTGWQPVQPMAIAVVASMALIGYAVVMLPILKRPPIDTYVRARMPWIFPASALARTQAAPPAA